MRGYDHLAIEKKAQDTWARLGLYETDLNDAAKDPYYLLVEFPYPSGDLHIGHWYAFAVTDIYARMLRMRGKNVLFPIGFDAFGLPAENAAIKHGLDPKDWTYKNIERMRTQLKSMGASFDWSKEVIACDPSYYKWTQWLFAKLFEHGLAEHREAAVKWCPKDQTVLANEQVIDGRCERCGTEVEEKRLTQWFLKITDYAERLLQGLDPLPWREEIKEAQRAWIGRSEGAKIKFQIATSDQTEIEEAAKKSIEVFTTRPETIFGATYVVLAPEHPVLADDTVTTSLKNGDAVRTYLEQTKKKTERERSEHKEKTGVRLEGVSVINPATKKEIPLFVADYVLGSYGTGAVMAVPAHDERDMEFALQFDLPITHVVMPRFVDARNPHIPGKEISPRNMIIGIVYNPRTQKYLGLKWKKQPWTTFITGGIDAREDAREAALREIQEETGYKSLKFIRVLGGPTQSEFYAAHKGVNRITHATTVLFELEDDTQEKVSQEEAEKHEPIWLHISDITRENMDHAELDLIRARLLSTTELAYTGEGLLTASGEFSGRPNEEVLWDIVTAVGGERATQYRLRDWLVSRQRYWGCPIPIVYDPEGKPHAIPAEHLPWLLPTDADFTPTGKSPLASSSELRERVTKIFGEGWTPEYDTLDTFVDSSWYFTRYLDPKDDHDFSNQPLMKKWLPVNRYSGGAEHTTLHLLYARFFIKALYDLALVPMEEPFTERFNRGIITGPDGQKMSKSKGNVINPDDYVQSHGADAVRLYFAFIGPYNEPGSYPWNLDGVASMRKFLERVVRLTDKVAHEEMAPALLQAFAHTAAKVVADGDRFKFNTGIASLMSLLNHLESLPGVPREALKYFIIMLAPFAPHLTEELFPSLGGEGSVHQAPWPFTDTILLEPTEKEVVIQVNGKRRGSLTLALGASEAEALRAAHTLPAVVLALGGKDPIRTVYVPGKILNLVIGG